jgi:thioredoxin 2
VSTTTSCQIVCPACTAVNRVPSGRSAAAARCGTCKTALFTAHPTEVDEATLQKHLRADGVPILLDVWAPWCGPCRTMAPQFERAASVLEPDVRLLKLNADTAEATCERLGVRGIPALFLFRDGKPVAQSAGAMAADAIVQWTRNHL